MKKIIAIFALCLVPFALSAADLAGAADVSITSDTASSAKSMALAEARRQVIGDVLGNYSERTQLADLLKSSKDSDLQNIVAATSIENEQQSATVYSATIKITLSDSSAQKWLDSAGVHNWLVSAGAEISASEKSELAIPVAGGLRDWIKAARALRDAGLDKDISVKSISNGTVILNVPLANRAQIASILRAGQ
ncbi:MAG: hypothetical protein LBJ18_02225 [Rickettsiales bacterium]|jgi:hypothetical protein|nr:hypothetical protein [Rickettsiales bacterium]